MPRISELTTESAAPAVQADMRAQEESFGFVLNSVKIIGHCPEIMSAQGALGRAIDGTGHIEPRLRYLLYVKVASINGCPF